IPADEDCYGCKNCQIGRRLAYAKKVDIHIANTKPCNQECANVVLPCLRFCREHRGQEESSCNDESGAIETSPQSSPARDPAIPDCATKEVDANRDPAKEPPAGLRLAVSYIDPREERYQNGDDAENNNIFYTLRHRGLNGCNLARPTWAANT